jgi:hypothetical protein
MSFACNEEDGEGEEKKEDSRGHSKKRSKVSGQRSNGKS